MRTGDNPTMRTGDSLTPPPPLPFLLFVVAVSFLIGDEYFAMISSILDLVVVRVVVCVLLVAEDCLTGESGFRWCLEEEEAAAAAAAPDAEDLDANDDVDADAIGGGEERRDLETVPPVSVEESSSNVPKRCGFRLVLFLPIFLEALLVEAMSDLQLTVAGAGVWS